MKPHHRLMTALAAGALVVGVFSSSANAITITSVTQTGAVPLSGSLQTPDFGVVGTIDFVTGTSLANVYRSPWETVTDAPINPQNGTAQYTSVRTGQAGYNFSGTTLSLFWGSPDKYNSITFWTLPNGTGSSVTETGTALGYGAYGHGHDQVSIFTDTVFQSVVLSSTDPAFEFANAVASCGPEAAGCAPAPTPLPAALPLFASAIAGVGGLFGWRKKRKAAAKNLAA